MHIRFEAGANHRVEATLGDDLAGLGVEQGPCRHRMVGPGSAQLGGAVFNVAAGHAQAAHMRQPLIEV